MSDCSESDDDYSGYPEPEDDYSGDEETVNVRLAM